MKQKTLARNKYQVKTLSRALQVLENVGDSTSGTSITELGRDLKVAKSTVHRVLATLKDSGYVVVDPVTSRYVLGSTVARLAEQLIHQSPLLNAGVPAIQRLAYECGETANLAILRGRNVLYIGKQESQEPLRMSGQVGRQLPAHCTALGKALLADLPDSQVRKLFGSKGKLHKLTANSIDSFSSLFKELAKIRREGIAYDHEEIYAGVECIATAVRDRSGKTVAAISISAPKDRMTSARTRLLKEQLLHEGIQVSAVLGYAPQKPKAIRIRATASSRMETEKRR